MSAEKKKGFTLVELLVVISIIALLMGVLMPALSKVRRSAKKVVCGSHFKQLGSIYYLYAEDSGQWLPRFLPESQEDKVFSFSSEVFNVLPYAIKDEMYFYLKKDYGLQAKFLVCPTKLKSRAGQISYFDDKGDLMLFPGGGLWSDYRWMGIAKLNGLCNMTGTDTRTVEESALKVTDSSSKLLAADENVVWNMMLDYKTSRLAHVNPSTGLPEGANRLFVDGSVSWNPVSEMAAGDKPLKKSSRIGNGIDPGECPPRYSHKRGYLRMYFW